MTTLEKIRAEIEQVEINGYIRDVECFRAGINTALNVLDKYAEKEPCEDAVSRQAIMKLKRHNLVEGQFVSLYDIEQLPSVRPQEQTGHWINHILSIECSCCGNKLFADDENENCEDYDAIDDLGYKFCPNCGAKMQESEKK